MLRTNIKETKENITKKIKETYLQSLKNGTTRAKAAEAAGVDVSTIWQWANDDEQFNKDIEIALGSRINIVVDELYLNAAGEECTDDKGKKHKIRGNIIAQIFYLKNRGKGKWKDKQELEIKDIKTINIKAFIQAGEEPVIKEEEEPEKIEETTRGEGIEDTKEKETVL